MKISKIGFLIYFIIISTLYNSVSCKAAFETPNSNNSKIKTNLTIINNVSQFNKIVKSSKDNLLMFDLFAEWCMPCKILGPILEEVAFENQNKVTIYKINIDNNPALAKKFNIPGIPFVVLTKGTNAVHAISGVHSKETYVRAINRFSSNSDKKKTDIPDGKIINGTRLIKLTTETSPGKIYVYQGEEVKIKIEKINYPYSMHIPDFNISKTSETGKPLEVTFKAKKPGVFPIFCNGKCPSGNGSKYGQIVVLQYKTGSEESQKYKEIYSKKAIKLITDLSPLILDVRTPSEYYSEHIKNAKLIPLYQLQQRILELKEYKNKPILIYCRSGNRSAVASEILIEQGFNNLYNLKDGIIGWVLLNNPLVK